ncbi:hypothetical protein ACVI1J_004924 [Bradyrhizobium diazoefficiens]
MRLPDGRRTPIATVEVVGDKKGDVSLRDCAGELDLDSGRQFLPIPYQAIPLTYTFPSGSNQMLLKYVFNLELWLGGIFVLQGQPPPQVKLKFRVLCHGVVTGFTDLVATD